MVNMVIIDYTLLSFFPIHPKFCLFMCTAASQQAEDGKIEYILRITISSDM